MRRHDPTSTVAIRDTISTVAIRDTISTVATHDTPPVDTVPMPVHLLVPMAGSPLSKRALEHACSMHPGARITVLYVVEDVEESYGARALVGTDELADRVEDRAEALFEEARVIADDHYVRIDTEVVLGDPVEEIVAYAADNGVDQIVIGSHGRSPMSQVLLGSVAQPVLRQAPVPVTVVR